MSGWVDLHSHVLPGIDDGPAGIDDALAMAAVAASAGTAVLAATPHVRADYPAVVPSEVGPAVAGFNATLRERGIALEVVPGGEVALIEALERPLEELRCVTLAANGRDLLVETPHGALPSGFERLLGAVRARGFRVLLAHPEHSHDFQREPERLGALVADGFLVQLTAGSFASSRKRPWRKLALRALEAGWVHVLASDAHSAGWRPPVLGTGMRAAVDAGAATQEELEWLARDAPRAILAGAELPPRPPRSPRPRRRPLSRLLGR